MSGARPRLILHTESSPGLGGQELRTLTEMRWLLEHGWDALLACPPGSRLHAEAAAAALPVAPLAMRSAVDVRAWLALRRLIAARGVDLVHTHSSIDSWLGALAARSQGRPVVRSRHVTIPIRRALVYRLADRVITSGQAAADRVRAAGIAPARIVAISAGVDDRRFHPGVSGARVRAELGLTGPTVGLVANVRGSKGHRFFLEAAREVLRKRPEARFLIVGDGVGFEDVQRRVREMGLGGEVIMTGFRRDIPEVLAALDVLVLPSVKSEATSQVVLQAFAVGTPVVATTIGGSPELVRDGETGHLVPPADAVALTAAILGVLGDPVRARALARAGQAVVQARHTLDAAMAQTTAVYVELLARR
jgi:glycosyltransferase involved in cell wall biosynthesis